MGVLPSRDSFLTARSAAVEFLRGSDVPVVFTDLPDALDILRRVVRTVKRLGIADEADCLDLIHAHYVGGWGLVGRAEDIDIVGVIRGAYAAAAPVEPRRPDGLDAADRPLEPTPFIMRDPRMIPPREFLYGQHYVRDYLSMTVAPGGVGKSAHAISELLAMASGRPLLGVAPVHPLRCWYWNGEDKAAELERRFIAAAMHFGVSGAALGGRLFFDSGRDLPIRLVESDGRGTRVLEPKAKELVAALRRRAIDVLVVDPLVTTHRVSENDNGAMNTVADTWRDIAGEAGCAIEFVHHARKDARLHGEDQGITQSRGAGSFVDAVRSARFLLPMSKKEAAERGVADARGVYRVEFGKFNLAPPPPSDATCWSRLENTALGNPTVKYPAGDQIGVAARWSPPDPAAALRDGVIDTVIARLAELGSTIAGRLHEQSPQWAGYVIADVMELDVGPTKSCDRTPEQNIDRGRVRTLIHQWTRAGGPLAAVEIYDRGAGASRPVLRPAGTAPAT